MIDEIVKSTREASAVLDRIKSMPCEGLEKEVILPLLRKAVNHISLLMKTILISTAYSKKSQTLLHSNIGNYIKSNRLIIFTQRFTYFFQPLPPYT